MKSKFETLELAIEFSKQASSLSELPYHAKDQLSRASLSISLNLAEGAARFTRNEKRRFYRMAFGSLKECQTLMKIYMKDKTELIALADVLGAKLWKLLMSLENKAPQKPLTANR